MPFLISLVFFLIFSVTTNQIFSFDAVTNAIACERSEAIRWFHANHLLYPALGALWYRVERLFSYEGYAIYSLARLNSLLVAAGLGIFYHGLTRLLSKNKALIGAAFVGSTYAVWHYAVDGRAIGTTVFFSSLLIWWLITIHKKTEVSVGDAVIFSDLSAFYVFSHAIGIFHLLPLAWYLYRRGGSKLAALYLIPTITLMASVYLAIFFTVVQPFSSSTSFINWTLGYAGYGGTQNALSSSFWANGPAAVVNGLWLGWREALVAARPVWSDAIGLLFLVGLVFGIKRSTENRLLLNTLMIWGLLVTGFLAFWSPGQEGFRLHVLIPWCAALFISFKDSLPFFRTLALASAIFFSLNLSGPIYHAAFIHNNVGYQLLSELDEKLQPSDVLVSGTPALIPNYEVLRPYFFPTIAGGTLSGWLLLTRENTFEKLGADMNRQLKEGRKIYWTDDIAPPLQQAFEKTFALKPGAVDQLLASFEKKPAFQLSNGMQIYEITKTHHQS